jgi:hypothetical protein
MSQTDPSLPGLDRIAAEVKDYSTIVGSCTNLNSDTCLGEFGIGSADGTTYLDPNNLPAGGTDPLSTTNSGYPLISPPGGATMTVTLLDATHTITAATYTATNGDSSSSTTSSSGSGSSSNSGSGSSTTAASAKGNSGVSKLSMPSLLTYIALMACICKVSL